MNYKSRFFDAGVVEQEDQVVEAEATVVVEVAKKTLSDADYKLAKTLSGSVPKELDSDVGTALVEEGLAMVTEGKYLRGHKWSIKYGF